MKKFLLVVLSLSGVINAAQFSRNESFEEALAAAEALEAYQVVPAGSLDASGSGNLTDDAYLDLLLATEDDSAGTASAGSFASSVPDGSNVFDEDLMESAYPLAGGEDADFGYDDAALLDFLTVKQAEGRSGGSTPALQVVPDRVLTEPAALFTSAKKESKPFTCTTCSKAFKDNFNLRRHLRVHTKDTPYTCPYCDKKFSDNGNWNKHKRRHLEHEPSKKPPIGIHTREKPFACHLCDYRATQKGNLTDHLRIHTGEKPFACHLCDYRATQKSNLTNHLRIHTGEKPFACHLCDYKATRKGHLTDHLRIHTGEKPFACHLCDYKATRKSNLTNHLKIHTGEKPLACHLCDYKATSKDHLTDHLNTHWGTK